jgi:4-carboxymuconolactone decarboxylase
VSRVPDLTAAELSPRQKQIYEEIARTRGGTVRGPFAIWLRLPDLAERADRLGGALRTGGRLDKRLFELMVLIVARHWSAQYEWFVHARHAREAGVSPEVIEALRLGRTPAFVKEDEQLVFDLVGAVNERRVLSEPLYERALSAFGLDLLIELVAAIGFYTMVAVTLNVFDAPVPGGERPLPAE